MASSSDTRSSPSPPSAFQGYSRQVSRRAATSYDTRPYERPFAHRRTASSSTLSFGRHLPFQRSTTPTATPPNGTDPRFSRLFTSPLGSPFLTTSDLPHYNEPEPMVLDDDNSQQRAGSPTPTADFSMIEPDDVDGLYIPGGYPVNQSRFRSAHMSTLNLSRSRHPGQRGGSISWAALPSFSSSRDLSSHSHHSLRNLLPRLWDVLSSPARTPSQTHVNQIDSSWDTSPTSLPRFLSSHPAPPADRPSPHLRGHATVKGKGKSKTTGFFSVLNSSHNDLDPDIDYAELSPLDGEEGELIDEACYIGNGNAQDPNTGIDILVKLPPEVALNVLTLLCPPPFSSSSNSSGAASIKESRGDAQVALRALLSCRLVSRKWLQLANDNGVWRALFLSKWPVDLRRFLGAPNRQEFPAQNVQAALGKTWEVELPNVKLKAKKVLGLPVACVDAPVTAAPLQLDWRVLFRERFELDLRWSNAVFTPVYTNYEQAQQPTSSKSGQSIMELFKPPPEPPKAFSPTMTHITGHTDSVYCLEFDSRRIITGSRDRTIKVWGLRSGKLLGTFVGAHRGSVLCLKFEKDWDREWDDMEEEEVPLASDDSSSDESSSGDVVVSRMEETSDRPVSTYSGRGRMEPGFMVSGSSDCSVCVWELQLGDSLEPIPDDQSTVDGHGSLPANNDDREVTATVKAVLKGHTGGVLDLRIDDQWIVSCSKDTVIRVWNRKTLKLHRTLRGHEGPVNAVGLQSGKVVSASGDGKMILWDINSGERLHTFEGHDRGLACIEFRHNLIVSGSNDCKIKVWDAVTGECLMTLTGHTALVRTLAFDPRYKRLVSGSYDQSIKLWDLSSSGTLIREFKGAHASHIFDVKFDACRIVSTSHDRKITILDFSQGLNTAPFI
ncbi:hypothetical protein CVT24_007201 [Panaeolus cyanescens]|uniref:F-box domain-containing protein n=1 Tax=Panaeolus cyanescens TaxID=181874 RepID=A0A409VJK9_9AGAR|nr:hypothetical protein CVT24_007201 [Panaeolus cyanescens]